MIMCRKSSAASQNASASLKPELSPDAIRTCFLKLLRAVADSVVG